MYERTLNTTCYSEIDSRITTCYSDDYRQLNQLSVVTYSGIFIVVCTKQASI